ncbi:MAG: response regulator [Bauldia sp.]|nr:response regulator [Bauldia sp.]MCW5717625.1 response regulator [Bauldia sp.]MCW5929961.1 response regulator [Chitinophagaceae bacterium]
MVAAPCHYRAPRLVLVDDDIAVLSGVAFALQTEGYLVEAFPDGESVLATGPRADCYIVDDRLAGGMSGLDLIAELRANTIDTPAILITTSPTLEVVRKARDLGVPIVEKPLMGAALVLAVERLLAPRWTQ